MNMYITINEPKDINSRQIQRQIEQHTRNGNNVIARFTFEAPDSVYTEIYNKLRVLVSRIQFSLDK